MMKKIRSQATLPKQAKLPVTTRSVGQKTCAVSRRRPHRGSLWRTASGEKRFSLSWPQWATLPTSLTRKRAPSSAPLTAPHTSTHGATPVRKKTSLAKRWMVASGRLALGSKMAAVTRRLSTIRHPAATDKRATALSEPSLKQHRLRKQMGSIGRKLVTQTVQKISTLHRRKIVPTQHQTLPPSTGSQWLGGTSLPHLGKGLLGIGLGIVALLLPTNKEAAVGNLTPRKRPPLASRLPQVPAFLARRTLPVPVQSAESLAKRLNFLFGMFLLVFIILAARAVDLTVIQHDTLKARAQSQYRKHIVTPAHRGRVLDRNGKTLSVSLPVKSLSVDIDRVTDPNRLAEKLAPMIEWPVEQLRQRLKSARKGSFPVLQHQLTPMVIHKIQQMEDPALFLTPEVQRFYPIGEITSHILGFTDFEGHGVEGLEKSQNEKLKGTAGESIFTYDRLGQPMPMAQTLKTGQPGMDVVLTIDTNVQYIAYRTLLKGITKAKAKGGTVVVMNPNNGEIYAMVNQPGFNPNNLGDSKADKRRNRAIADAYEPGSTFKTFTVSTALDLGLVTPNTTFDVQGGTLRIGGRTIRDFHLGKRNLSVTQILETSSNVGAAKIGLLLGNDNMDAMISRFGFGKTTGVGFHNESPGSVPDISAYRIIGLANRSYGYGITATPLQLATATAAAINGGLYYKPRLIAGSWENGQLVPNAQEEPRRVLKPATSATMREILALAVGPEGTAPQARIEGYTVAGKTGTARKAMGNKGYVRGHYFSSFVGFIPADKPKLLIYVSVDEPQGVFYGGLVAAPIFREIGQEILPILSIFPENRTDPELPAIQEAATSDKKGTDIAPKPSPKENPKADKTGKKGEKNEEPKEEEPSPLLNLSLADALEQLKKEDIIPLVEGHGRVLRVEKSADGTPRLFLQ